MAVSARSLSGCSGSSVRGRQPGPEGGADFICLWTVKGRLYVAAVIDLFSWRVVGWSMNEHDLPVRDRRADYVHPAQRQAGCTVASSGPEQPIHQRQLQRLTADHGTTCSMTRSGNVWDDTATERTVRKNYRIRDGARVYVFDCIERFTTPSVSIRHWASSTRGTRRRQVTRCSSIDRLIPSLEEGSWKAFLHRLTDKSPQSGPDERNHSASRF